MRSRLTYLVGAFVALVISGCVISPIPEPPQATLDASKVFSADPTHRGPAIIGDPGAASPVGALVRVYHLDGQEEPAEGLVEANGSFMVDLIVDEGHELRFQVISDDARSEPIDLITGSAGTSPVPVERALADCLLLEPQTELDLDATQTVTVENNCADEVTLEAPTLRLPLTGIEVGADRTWPEVLTQGSTISVGVQVQAGWDIEDIFFIEASSPEHDRRPITLVPPP